MAIDALEADTFSFLVVQDLDVVPVKDADDLTGEGECFTEADENEQEGKGNVPYAVTISAWQPPCP